MKYCYLTGLIVTALGLTACQSEQQVQQRNSSTTASAQQLAIWPKVTSEVKQSAETEKQIDNWLAKMSIEQKVAQVIQPEIRDFTVADMRKYGFGSYLNGGGAFPKDNKHASTQDWVKLAEDLYQASIDDSEDGVAIPTMWGTDAVHGHNNVIGATLFPHNIALGATHDSNLVKKIAAATAEEVAATGIDWVFAPTVAVTQDDRWGRSYESYSENPELVKSYAYAFTKGMQGEGENLLTERHVIATLKHFVGDGGTDKGDDQGDNLASEQDLYRIHGQGYVGGIQAGAQTIMASFNSWHGKKNHGNHYLLTQVLKNKMGFDGLVVGDWNGHGQVKGCTNESCPQAFNAGVDIFMVPGKAWKPLYENTLAQVKSGEIAQSRLDDAVRRILRVKYRAGLFSKPSPAKRALAGMQSLIGKQEHRDLAREAVRKSLVLLKNNEQILPLSINQTVLVAGAAANDIAQQSGGWSVTWQGTDNQNSDFPGATSILQGIKQQVAQGNGKVIYSENGDIEQKPDVAIVVFGETPYAEGHGDIDNLEFERGNKKSLALLKKLSQQNIPVVSVFLTGRPLWVNPEINASNAFVVAWLPGTEGEGVADVLFKDAQGNKQFDFVGKLSFSWPNSPYQTAINLGQQPYEPLFAYDYGLHYGETTEIAQLPEQFDKSQVQSIEMPIFDGVVHQPWRLVITDDNHRALVTSNRQQNAGIAIRTVDRVLQEDARQLTWSGNQTAAMVIESNFTNDLRAYVEQNSELSFDIKLLKTAESPLNLKLACEHDCGTQVDLSEKLLNLSSNDWQTVKLNLPCLRKQGVDFGKINQIFKLETQGAWQLQISNIVIKPAQQSSSQCES